MSKKSFKTDLDPAMQFISQAAQAPAPEASAQDVPVWERPAEPYPPERELKSARLNLVIRPSTIDGLRKVSTMQRSSVNDLINRILEAYLEYQADIIGQYDRVFGKE